MARVLINTISQKGRKPITSLNTSSLKNRLPVAPFVRNVPRNGHPDSLYGVRENTLRRNRFLVPKFAG